MRYSEHLRHLDADVCSPMSCRNEHAISIISLLWNTAYERSLSCELYRIVWLRNHFPTMRFRNAEFINTRVSWVKNKQKFMH